MLVAVAVVKFAVVLAVLQLGFGGAAIPPVSVMVVLAVLVALCVTAQVASSAWGARTAAKAAEPVRAWVEKHAPAREKQSFLELQRELRPVAEREAVGEND